MGYVQVFGADVADGRIARLKVKSPRLPARVIDRDAAVALMKDGHSLLPVVGGAVGTALQLVEVSDEHRSIRTDNAPDAEDRVPEGLPSVDEARADRDVLPAVSH